MPESIGISLVLAAICLIIWFVAIKPIMKVITRGVAKAKSLRRDKQKSEEVHCFPATDSAYISDEVVLATSHRGSEEILQSQPKDDAENRAFVYLRGAYLRGEECKLTIAGAITEFGDRLSEGVIIGTAIKAGYPTTDVATAMVGWNYSADSIAVMLQDIQDLPSSDCARVLGQVYSDKPEEEKLKLILSAFDDEDDDFIDVVKVLVEISTSPIVVGIALYDHTSFRLGKIASELGIVEDYQSLSKIAQGAEIDLTDMDEFSCLRNENEGNFSFHEAALLLSAGSKNALEILEAEQEYEKFDLTEIEQGEAIFEALRPCGFSDKEILSAIDSASITESVGNIVLSAIEKDVSLDVITEFLQSDNWENNLKELWNEFDSVEVDVADAIEIMYALIPLEKRHFNPVILEPQKATESI